MCLLVCWTLPLGELMQSTANQWYEHASHDARCTWPTLFGPCHAVLAAISY